MSKLVKSNLTIPELKLIQNNSEIHCYHCGSHEFIKAGKNQKGEQSYKCKDCKRKFLEKFLENAQVQNRDLPLSEDVWSARDYGLKVPKHKKQDKIIFADIDFLLNFLTSIKVN